MSRESDLKNMKAMVSLATLRVPGWEAKLRDMIRCAADNAPRDIILAAGKAIVDAEAEIIGMKQLT